MENHKLVGKPFGKYGLEYCGSNSDHGTHKCNAQSEGALTWGFAYKNCECGQKHRVCYNGKKWEMSPKR